MATRNTPTHKSIIFIQNKLEEQLNRIIEMYKLLNGDITSQKNNNEKNVIELEDLVNITRSKISLDCLYELTKSIFAKDLRRIIAYLQISDRLEHIADRVINIYEFYEHLQKKHKLKHSDIDNKLISEMVLKIIRRLKLTLGLIISENIEDAKKLIQQDASVNKFYKQIVEKISKNKILKNKSIPKSKATEIQLGFMLAIKNIERSGDDIKSIGRSILFIKS